MEPYTPRTQTGARKKNITLSQREYSKITGTIASVRRHRLQQDDIDGELNGRVHGSSSRHSHTGQHHEPSFIAETSFVKAPLNSRVSLGGNAIGNSKGKAKQESLDHIPIDIQETLILEDLLYVLMGIEGEYIRFHPDYSPDEDDPIQGVKFVVEPSLDPSVRNLVERLLPLGTYYTGISAFIEHRSHLDYGLVNHALCAAIRDMLKDYQTLLSQLEHSFNTSPQFSLQKLWFYVHPTVHTLSIIYQLTLELGTADDPSADLSSSSNSPSTSDAEEEARNEALGIGTAKLKSVLSENGLGTSSAGIPVKGGEVLSIIYERMQSMSGDPTANMVYATLLREAGTPYVNMLKEWVMTGRLVDPYEELMVKESKFINRGILEMDYTDEYWERRYTLRDGSTISGSKGHKAGIPLPRSAGGHLPGGACIPPLLEGWKHKILLAGKYLNVIRECGIEIHRVQNDPDDETFSMNDERFYTFLEDAYTHANQTLLQLLLKDQDLIPRLRSLKRYFFLSQSFFLTHLLDLASNELRKSTRSASLVKLQSLLELTLNTEEREDTMFREDVKVVMAGSGLYDWLMKIISTGGLGSERVGESEVGNEEAKKEQKDDKKPLLASDTLALDYHVKFPLSLVISRKTILRYQLIFRFLLHLKNVEQSLGLMWIEQKTTPSSPFPSSLPSSSSSEQEFEKWRLRVFLLRARMLAFIQQILSFATFEVLEPNWRALEVKLDKVTTVDQLLRDHLDFLDTCLKECMLTSAKLLKAYNKLIVTCATFALYAAPYTKSANQAISGTETTEGQRRRWEYQLKFEKNFDHWYVCHGFKVFLDCVQFYASSENGSLLPLVVRLSSISRRSTSP
ncbi:Spc98 family-domain-containing protein [Lentinula aff. lateritia]|uniref:Spc98 family-domain-containing protein n=1 Tax=Lentinula aff. lateritia TaxID=2804960 RepID=A0ACC1TPT8_9AGAR|nr:Spc98 family-domain-containing protein [Lentinula aff. lateritia]